MVSSRATMLPRNPLTFKVMTIVAAVGLAVLLFYTRESRVVINVVMVTQAPVRLVVDNEVDAAKRSVENEAPRELPKTTTTTELPTTTRPRILVDGTSLKFTINQEPCPDSFYLAIYVHSSPENTEKRRVVRTTWAAKDILKKHKAKLVFVVGQTQNDNAQAALEIENKIYSDIVQANFTDTYRNLTYKAISGLKWVSENCGSVMYVLKTDDDIVVDIHRVVRLMRSYIEHKWGRRKILGGYIWQNMNVDRNKTSKWYTSPEEFPKDFFLSYCSGSAYIMSSDVVKMFYEKSRDVPFFWVDDYYITGMLAHETNITAHALNDRFVLENKANIKGLLQKDNKTRLVFIHSPNTSVSVYAWNKFLERW